MTQEWSGKRLARAPDFTANFSFDYTTRFADQSSVTLAANINFSTAFALNNASLYDAIVGGVNLAPVDAAWLFGFTTPDVPEAWHAALSLKRGTVVFTHP